MVKDHHIYGKITGDLVRITSHLVKGHWLYGKGFLVIW